MDITIKRRVKLWGKPAVSFPQWVLSCSCRTQLDELMGVLVSRVFLVTLPIHPRVPVWTSLREPGSLLRSCDPTSISCPSATEGGEQKVILIHIDGRNDPIEKLFKHFVPRFLHILSHHPFSYFLVEHELSTTHLTHPAGGLRPVQGLYRGTRSL